MKILVLGDRIQDFYVFGRVERLCPEAPVPVFITERNEVREGGAALVAANLKALGADVIESYGSYSEKKRFFAGNHLLLRVDEDAFKTIKASCPLPLDGVDAIVVSDYGKGGISHPEARHICLHSPVPVFVDSKKNMDSYAGCFATFPNKNESTLRLGQHVIQKLGENGCSVDGTHVPSRPRKVYDVTGAGDVFLAAFVVEYLRSKDLMAAAHFANECAGISVEHLGTYVVQSGLNV